MGSDFYISPGTRAKYTPTSGMTNISMDFNAAPSGNARGTEVVIPDNASPEVRAAAQRYNAGVASFASQYGIQDYPVRGVKTRSENGRGVSNTIHTEPFFNSDLAMQQAILENPQAFAEVYRDAFGTLPDMRLIAAHGIGADRGAASSVFKDETSFGELMAKTLLGSSQPVADDAMEALGRSPIRRDIAPFIGQQPIGTTANAPTGGILSNEGNQMAQQPQGLLGSMGIQRRDPNAQGETSQPFYNRKSFGDTMARIAPALGRMGVMGLEGPAQAALDDRNKRQGDERAKQAQAARTNQTREWIASQPNGEQFAAMFDAVGGAATLKAMQDANAPAKQTSAMQNYEFLISQGMDPKTATERAFSGGTTINTGDVGTGQYLYGAQAGLPAGWRLDIKTGEASPIPGGDAERDIAVEQEAEKNRLKTATDNDEVTTSVVSGSIDKLTKMLNDSEGAIFNLPEAGIVGNALGSFGVNQQAVDFKNELGTVQANIAFDRLQQMREASKTGGALGAVSERELDLLMNAYGNLNQSTSATILRQNLQDIKRIMTKIENDPTASAFYYGGNSGNVGATSNGGGDGFSVTGRID